MSVKLKRLAEEEVVYNFQHMEDGGHTYLKCSDCDALLVDIWHTRPNEDTTGSGQPDTYRLRASCPFCGDESYVVKIQGGFHPGCISEVTNKETGDDRAITTIDRVEEQKPGAEDGLYYFHMIKAFPEAKPKRRV